MTSQITQSIALWICVRFNSAEDSLVWVTRLFVMPQITAFRLLLAAAAVELLRESYWVVVQQAQKIAEVRRNFLWLVNGLLPTILLLQGFPSDYGVNKKNFRAKFMALVAVNHEKMKKFSWFRASAAAGDEQNLISDSHSANRSSHMCVDVT